MIDCRTLTLTPARLAHVRAQAARHPVPLALRVTTEQYGDIDRADIDVVDGAAYLGNVPLVVDDGEVPSPRPKPPRPAPPPPEPPTVAELVEATLTERARAAVTVNRGFLAIATPTAAQVRAQVQTLTRGTSALIRLMVARELLDDDVVD